VRQARFAFAPNKRGVSVSVAMPPTHRPPSRFSEAMQLAGHDARHAVGRLRIREQGIGELGIDDGPVALYAYKAANWQVRTSTQPVRAKKVRAMTQNGFLAIWSDVDPADETDYLHWLTREHVQERLAVPVFLAVRVFRTDAEGRARFLIFYRLQEASAVGSAAYLARLNAPTPWSQKIMPRLKNFMRGGGSIVQECGSGAGGHVAPVLIARSEVPDYCEAAVEIAKADRIAATRVFEVDRGISEIRTNEKAMRAGDRSFEAMLLIEALDEGELAAGLAMMGTRERAVYRQIFSLDARDFPLA
jgi:hypothetical protein